MEQKVYLLYESDAHISTNSLVLYGVFSDYDELTDACRTLIGKRIDNYKDEWVAESEDEVIERVIDEFYDNRLQTQGYNVNLYCKVATLNKVEEI